MKPNFNLNDKVAVITGGGGALGSCVAQSLSESGVKIAILDLTEESAQKTIDLIESNGGEAIGFASNVLSKDSIEKVVMVCASPTSRPLRTPGNHAVRLSSASARPPGSSGIPEGHVWCEISGANPPCATLLDRRLRRPRVETRGSLKTLKS